MGMLRGCGAVGVVLCLLLAACRSTSGALDERPGARVSQQLIYVVHGDASYLYHDAGGRPHQADEDAVAQARAVAAGLPDAEVFIFHQRPHRRFFLLPRRGGTWQHWRAGRLIREENYDGALTGDALDTEAALVRRYAMPGAARRFFLYYGHEIPETGGAGYHRTRPAQPLTRDAFADGLAQLVGTNPFDLVVLSTCNNGTPGMVAALAPHARYVFASPENLHLSHIDSRPLQALAGLRLGELADRLAQQAFDSLRARTQTAVTLAVYDTERLTAFLSRAAPAYDDAIPESPLPAFSDCADDPTFLTDTTGVTVFYRPPAFGRNKNKTTHSGWGCPHPATR